MTIGVPDVEAADLDLTRYMQSGDVVAMSQGVAEPLPLLKSLVAQADGLENVKVFVGSSFSGAIPPELGDAVELSSYGAIGLGSLASAGKLEIVPCNYLDLPWMVTQGPQRPSVLLVHLSPADEWGYHTFGIWHDYLGDALDQARVIIAEINDQMPSTAGPVRVHRSRITAAVRTSRPLITVPTPDPSPAEEAIAEHVAALVPERATIQLGIGAVPRAVAENLVDRRELRVHSGLVGDWLVSLADAGALETTADTDIVVTGAAMGTQRLYDFAGSFNGLSFRPISHVNPHAVLAQIPRLAAINSAIQVDLFGQVNAEVIGSKYVATIGGHTDFLRGAQQSEGGRAIVALPSTASRGTRSRIVAALDQGCVTTPRAGVDYIVTEHGVAELRGRSMRERAEAIVAVAAPEFRDELTEAAASTLGRG